MFSVAKAKCYIKNKTTTTKEKYTVLSSALSLEGCFSSSEAAAVFGTERITKRPARAFHTWGEALVQTNSRAGCLLQPQLQVFTSPVNVSLGAPHTQDIR